MTFTKNAAQIGEYLQSIPHEWVGKGAIMEMKRAHYSHWRQMEWIGFYFQFLCEQTLPPIMKMPGPKYGSTTFDGLKEIPWDFKAHAMNTSSHHVIVNDKAAVMQGIKEYGAVGVILALGEVAYNDKRRTFQKWHENLLKAVYRDIPVRELIGAHGREYEKYHSVFSKSRLLTCNL